MTRKQSLQEAIEALSHDPNHSETVRLLQDILDELPMIHWSDKSIRDTVEQFILDNGRTPTASDFRKKAMPPHTVIKQKYGITLSEWLEQNYPTCKPTFSEKKEAYTQKFIEDYNRLKPRTSDDFNAYRGADTKCWQSLANYYNVACWGDLLKKLGLPSYSRRLQNRATNLMVIIHPDDEALACLWEHPQSYKKSF